MRRPGYSRKFKTIGCINQLDLNGIRINYVETGFELEVGDTSNHCKDGFYEGEGKEQKKAITRCTY